MAKDTSTLIDSFYGSGSAKKPQTAQIRKSPKAKYAILDGAEFARGREVLGGLIVHGMVASGGTDVDWMIEHNGGFVVLEFKGFHDDKISLPKGQMIAYEQLHEKLNEATRCYLYIVGCDDVDFSDPDAPVWLFEMSQWKNGSVPRRTRDVHGGEKQSSGRYVVYRDFMEEVRVARLREIVDSHWREFES